MEAIWFESRRHGRFFQRGELDGLEASPCPAPMDRFGFVEAVDRLGQRAVAGLSDAAD
jgi:hypothetical protein